MKTFLIFLFLAVGLSNQTFSQELISKPPLAKAAPVEDIYFGRKIVDPYRYMENLNDK